MDWAFIATTFKRLISALPLTLEVWALSIVLGGLIGMGVTWARTSGIKPLELFARGYVFVFRGTPLLVQLFVIYYGLASFPAVRASFLWPLLRDAFVCATAQSGAVHRGLSERNLPHGAGGDSARPDRGGAGLRHVARDLVPARDLSRRAAPRPARLHDRTHLR